METGGADEVGNIIIGMNGSLEAVDAYYEFEGGVLVVEDRSEYATKIVEAFNEQGIACLCVETQAAAEEILGAQFTGFDSKITGAVIDGNIPSGNYERHGDGFVLLEKIKEGKFSENPISTVAFSSANKGNQERFQVEQSLTGEQQEAVSQISLKKFVSMVAEGVECVVLMDKTGEVIQDESKEKDSQKVL